VSLLPVLTLACVLPFAAAVFRRRSSGAVLLLAALSLFAMGVAGLVSTSLDWVAGWIVIVTVPVLCAAAWWPESRTGVGWALRILRGHPLVRGLLVSSFAFVILIGVPEWSVYVLAKIGAIAIPSPIQVVGKGTEDWREATLLTSRVREPDPVLFWRTLPVPPYNAQRFQGPIAVVPKPARVYRIMCYGDSNTDGHLGDGGWPDRLGRSLVDAGWPGDGVKVEVINAGVMGYSSHQGWMRFREEVGVFTPDLVFVSFGWNDAPEALGQPDKSFEVPPSAVVTTQRLLMRFRTYQLLRTILQPANTPAAATVGPRVAIADYVANLRAFVAEGGKRGARVVLLTRPHRLSEDALSTSAGWRSTVADYNRALLALAKRENVPCVDVRQRFESLPELFADECHFTGPGHDRMARILTEALPRLAGK
jgi:lysophospholipase L1-like esterase